MSSHSILSGAPDALPAETSQVVCSHEPREQIYEDCLAIFNRLHYAMAVVNSKLEMIWMNEAGANLLRKNDGMSLIRNYLVLGGSGLRQEVQNILSRFSDETIRGRFYCINVPRQRCRQPIHLVITSLGRRKLHCPAKHDFCLMLLMFDPEIEVVPDSELIMRAYGLTVAESKIVMLLMQGKKLDQVARLLVKKKETVRKQLGNIFAKTGTNRQSDLIRVLLRGPAGLF